MRVELGHNRRLAGCERRAFSSSSRARQSPDCHDPKVKAHVLLEISWRVALSPDKRSGIASLSYYGFIRPNFTCSCSRRRVHDKGMGNKFATLLRAERERSGKSMGAVARHIDVSVTYLSDVERDTRPPLSPERIRRAAECMGSDENTLTALLRAAQAAAQAIKRPLPNSARGREAGAALQRGWASFDDETFERIMGVIDEGKKG